MSPQDRSYHTFFAEAIGNLSTGTQWVLYGDTYESIQWQSGNIPSKEAVEAEAQRLQSLWTNTEYQRLRAPEYPDMKIYLDAVVKGDQEQMQAYIDACLAVKEKYPKPEGL
jgi:hypothetical protein